MYVYGPYFHFRCVSMYVCMYVCMHTVLTSDVYVCILSSLQMCMYMVVTATTRDSTFKFTRNTTNKIQYSKITLSMY